MKAEKTSAIVPTMSGRDIGLVLLFESSIITECSTVYASAIRIFPIGISWSIVDYEA